MRVMKLRNKKTGEINLGDLHLDNFNSLAELNAEWEDYEDDDLSKIIEWINKGLEDETLPVSVNDFVEKLKAWKRLKDGGFTIRQWRHIPDMKLTTGSFINIKGFIPQVVKNIKDLDLLFGGEE